MFTSKSEQLTHLNYMLQTFCLRGRLIFGPDVRSLFLTVFLIVAPVILFCSFVAHRLIDEFDHNHGELIVAICVIFTVYVSSFFLTS